MSEHLISDQLHGPRVGDQGISLILLPRRLLQNDGISGGLVPARSVLFDPLLVLLTVAPL
jgi:hypothetical protein